VAVSKDGPQYRFVIPGTRIRTAIGYLGPLHPAGNRLKSGAQPASPVLLRVCAIATSTMSKSGWNYEK
jgi:hypothetical protein